MLSGEGTLLYGGRWNSPGRQAVYLGGSLALASLELLVHLKVPDVLRSYRKLCIRIPRESIEVVNTGDLPGDWATPTLHPATQEIADQWLDSLKSAVLRVPSAVVVGEVNYIVNPVHPDFAELEPGTITDYRFDSRILKAYQDGDLLPSETAARRRAETRRLQESECPAGRGHTA